MGLRGESRMQVQLRSGGLPVGAGPVIAKLKLWNCELKGCKVQTAGGLRAIDRGVAVLRVAKHRALSWRAEGRSLAAG